MIYLNGAIAAIATANSNPPAPVPGWISTLSAVYPPPIGPVITPYGTYTTGIRFTYTGTNPCKGIRFLFGSGFPATPVTATLWDDLTMLAIASEVVPGVLPDSDNQTTVSFGTHVLNIGKSYSVTTYFAGGYNAQVTPVPPPALPALTEYTVTQSYVSQPGYGYPAGTAAGYGFYVEPLF